MMTEAVSKLREIQDEMDKEGRISISIKFKTLPIRRWYSRMKRKIQTWLGLQK